MKQLKQKMPVYTGDVSGVPSALYELGGMVVMHDASGCNSTYNTHDELRWYDMESLIYISAMNEIDAVMGNDQRLVQEISEAAEELKPAFIAIAGTPIPYLNGMDFHATVKKLQQQFSIPVFYVPTNGTHTYVRGVSNAWLELTRALQKQETGGPDKKTLEEQKRRALRKNIKVNIIGITPLDFGLSGYDISLQEWLEQRDFTVQCCYSMGCRLENIAKAYEADVSLVVSSTGQKTAELLEELWGIPYVAGTPMPGFSDVISEELRKAARTRQSEKAYRYRSSSTDAPIRIVGETIISESLAAALEKKYHVPVQVLCPVETENGLLLDNDRQTMEEEELKSALKGATLVIADPLLEFLKDETSEFLELPHIACSGRIYASELPDYFRLAF